MFVVVCGVRACLFDAFVGVCAPLAMHQNYILCILEGQRRGMTSKAVAQRLSGRTPASQEEQSTDYTYAHIYIYMCPIPLGSI